MLFSRNIAPSCSYCRFGSGIGNGEIACLRRGITSAGGSCRRFVYDPLKREPERPPVLVKKLSEEMCAEDFAI
ncbi:MAG: hypothetical protein GX847_09650 [Clostridiales bacterium]|nr:hypothetical protein [Clostridiales bacterium]